MFGKKDILKYLAKFTEKHLINLSLSRDLDIGAFLWFLRNFYNVAFK